MSQMDSVRNEAEPGSEEIARVLANIVIPPCPRIVLAMVQEARADDPALDLVAGGVGGTAPMLLTMIVERGAAWSLRYLG